MSKWLAELVQFNPFLSPHVYSIEHYTVYCQTETEKDWSMFKWPQCDFMSMNWIYFNEHIPNIHGAHQTFPFCQIGFWNLFALKKHIDTAHKEEEKVQSNLECSQCEFQSMDYKIEKEYIKNTHEDALKCTFCQIEYKGINRIL